ncbi:MAG: substrate-binding periplasmic protein, partial [Candidatus Heimdallarchaeota archaeon]
RVASSPDWPPFEYLDPVTDEFAGFEVDILEEVMRRLGEEEGVTITVDWVEMDFGSIKEAVVAKTVDLGVSGFSVTPERWESVQYVTSHSVTEAQIIALNTTAATVGMLESVAELADYDLDCGAQSGTTQEDELIALIAAGTIPEGTLVTFTDYLAAMDDLVAGALDTVYAETPVSYYWISQYAEQGYEIEVIFAKPYWPVAFIAHHDSDVLVAKISGVIAELISEGWIADLAAEYEMVY